ncbi:uncharacterized protein VTP21DRAFT_9095 [Calcarisporiella thermophila]|uniref:uncharacterized protein n=1 Tax=Calcarisporiella thermophila TaxID=911321 RepID=UPI00374449CD
MLTWQAVQAACTALGFMGYPLMPDKHRGQSGGAAAELLAISIWEMQESRACSSIPVCALSKPVQQVSFVGCTAAGPSAQLARPLLSSLHGSIVNRNTLETRFSPTAAGTRAAPRLGKYEGYKGRGEKAQSPKMQLVKLTVSIVVVCAIQQLATASIIPKLEAEMIQEPGISRSIAA